jgi:UDP:flavonoid glycosyltransferase YjiC (YdhE family)
MGSLGDTLPFVYLGQRLLERGHQVTLLANEHYRALIESRGLEFVSILPQERYLNFIANRKTKSESVSLVDMANLTIEQIEPVYNYLISRYVPGQTVVAAQGYALGARIAQETHNIPLATVHLQPMWFRSTYGVVPPFTERTPRWIKRFIQWIADVVLDAAIGKPAMRFRSTLGLKPVPRALRHWWHSPECIIGFFPEWFSPRQPDWPINAHAVGFPIPGSTDPDFDLADVNAFLDGGPPPLVFSQSSIASDTRAFFETSIGLAQQLGQRALFLTTLGDLLPAKLPTGMAHFSFVPLDRVLSRCRAHLHHGGIGTIAQTLKAGIPQITVAKIYDQPDNSARLVPLGVSANIAPRKYRIGHVLPILKNLLESPDVADRCRRYAATLATEDPLSRASELLESLAHSRVS